MYGGVGGAELRKLPPIPIWRSKGVQPLRCCAGLVKRPQVGRYPALSGRSMIPTQPAGFPRNRRAFSLARPLRHERAPDAACNPAGDDRDLLNWVNAEERHRDERVTHLVMRDHLPLVRIEQTVAFLEPRDDPL